MSSRRIPYLLLGFVSLAMTPGLRAQPVPSSSDRAAQGIAYFETHIRPLLAARCYSCHAARSGRREGGLVLDHRAGWAVGGDRGPAIVPGKVQASLLVRAVRYADSDLQMPPDKALSRREIERLEHWVRIGAPDPRAEGSASVDRRNPADPEAGRKHWAFQPLARRSAPAVAKTDWADTSLDRFVLAKLESQGLEPAPDADRRTLLRRVYFQLTGLPPTPDQVESFVQDRRENAWEFLVERLLSSPHFGERWGRHWLDLARYADSNGLDENFLFREAWRYRNWAIAAVNDDLPFDRFLLEQIAGDLLPHPTVEQRDRQRIAAGFLVVGPKVLLGNDPQRQRMEVADEQLDTIGRAILGQTLGCARCHDHKFDPVPTADYYALAGIMTSTRVMERRYMLGQQRVMERLEGLGTDGDVLESAYERYWRERPQLLERQRQAKAALELLKKKDAAALQALATRHPTAVADGAKQKDGSPKQRLEAQQALLATVNEKVARPPGIPPRAMIPEDVESPADEYVRQAGQFDRRGARVPRGFLQVLSSDSPKIPAGQSGRRQLARWLTDVDQGAGALTARVLANRIWYQLMGRGLVRTVDNFGRTGEAPTHPELLDDLAAELVDSGWSTKHLVRHILLSRTFRMSSRHDDAAHAVDPENRWLWRAHRRRLDPESLRDAMLQAAGQLDRRPKDSTVWYLGDQATAVGANKNRRRTDFPCRSVYLPVIRNDLPELFEVFDFADPHATTGMRPDTMVATQGLFLLNDESVMQMAESMARRLMAEDSAGGASVWVPRLIEIVLSGQAAAEDCSELERFLDARTQQLVAQGVADAEHQALTLTCHALLASSRFQILE